MNVSCHTEMWGTSLLQVPPLLRQAARNPLGQANATEIEGVGLTSDPLSLICSPNEWLTKPKELKSLPEFKAP